MRPRRGAAPVRAASRRSKDRGGDGEQGPDRERGPPRCRSGRPSTGRAAASPAGRGRSPPCRGTRPPSALPPHGGDHTRGAGAVTTGASVTTGQAAGAKVCYFPENDKGLIMLMLHSWRHEGRGLRAGCSWSSPLRAAPPARTLRRRPRRSRPRACAGSSPTGGVRSRAPSSTPTAARAPIPRTRRLRERSLGPPRRLPRRSGRGILLAGRPQARLGERRGAAGPRRPPAHQPGTR